MAASTLKPSKTKAVNVPHTQSRWGFYPPVELDEAERAATEALNERAAELDAWTLETDAEFHGTFDGWRDKTFNELVEQAERLRKDRREQGEERIRLLTDRRPILQRSVPAFKRHIEKCAADLRDQETKAVEALRLRGVDGYAMTEFADANKVGVDERLRKYCREHDPDTMAKVGELNRAKNALTILESQLLIMPTAGHSRINWPATDAPEYLTTFYKVW